MPSVWILQRTAMWFCCLFSPPLFKNWSDAVLAELLREKRCGLSETVRKTLLQQEDADTFDEPKSSPYVIMGLPRRPLYKELANRLERWKAGNENALIVGATKLGLKEENPPVLPSAPSLTMKSLESWLKQAGDTGVLRILGLRSTVGTVPGALLPPSRTKLLEAGMAPHKAKVALSVAARARAKHANRSKNSFFGTVKGNDEEQNAATINVLERILADAVWINIHTFGGLDGKAVLEVRIESGYGARWVADWSNPLHPTDIQFRGFLEPTMVDGHEKGWKH